MRSTSFCGAIRSGMNPEPIDSLYSQQVKKKLAAILDLMGEMERRVLEMRLGLINGREMIVEEVAAELGKSPQQILRWEAKALRIMQHSELACTSETRREDDH